MCGSRCQRECLAGENARTFRSEGASQVREASSRVAGGLSQFREGAPCARRGGTCRGSVGTAPSRGGSRLGNARTWDGGVGTAGGSASSCAGSGRTWLGSGGSRRARVCPPRNYPWLDMARAPRSYTISNAPTLRRSDAPTLRRSDAPTLRRSDAPTLRRSDAKRVRCSVSWPDGIKAGSSRLSVCEVSDDDILCQYKVRPARKISFVPGVGCCSSQPCSTSSGCS